MSSTSVVVNNRGENINYNTDRPLTNSKRGPQNYQKYMDTMNEALNKNIEKNIFPYWRNHQSLKGKADTTNLKIRFFLTVKLQVGVL